MKYIEIAIIDALHRAKLFLADNQSALAEGDSADIARALQKVDEILDRLRRYGVEQDGGLRGIRAETAKQRQLRLDLCKQWLKPIAVIARRNLRHVPEYKSLQMPKASDRGNGFIASARAMGAVAAAHREALVSYGLPDSFVEDLNRAVDEFEASIRDRDHHRGLRVGATKGLEEDSKEARTILTVLDARMLQWAKGNEMLLSTWQGVRRIRRRPGRVSRSAASAPSSPSEAAPENDRPLALA